MSGFSGFVFCNEDVVGDVVLTFEVGFMRVTAVLEV